MAVVVADMSTLLVGIVVALTVSAQAGHIRAPVAAGLPLTHTHYGSSSSINYVPSSSSFVAGHGTNIAASNLSVPIATGQYATYSSAPIGQSGSFAQSALNVPQYIIPYASNTVASSMSSQNIRSHAHSTPVATSQSTSYSSAPLISSQNAHYFSAPLLSAHSARYSSAPLVSSQSAQYSSAPLTNGQSAQYSSASLASSQTAQYSSAPLAGSQSAHYSSAPLVSGPSSHYSSTSLGNAQSAQYSSGLLASGQSTHYSRAPTVSGQNAQYSAFPLVSGQSAQYSNAPLVSGQSAHYLTVPLASGQSAQYATAPLVRGQSAHYLTAPLASGQSAQYATAPLASGQSAQYATAPLASGQSAQYSSTPLVSGHSAQYSNTPLASGQSAQYATAPLVSGQSAQYSSTPLVSGHSAQYSTAPLASGQSAQYLTASLASGQSAQFSSAPLVSGQSAQYSTAPLASGQSAQYSSAPLVSNSETVQYANAPLAGSQSVNYAPEAASVSSAYNAPVSSEHIRNSQTASHHTSKDVSSSANTNYASQQTASLTSNPTAHYLPPQNVPLSTIHNLQPAPIPDTSLPASQNIQYASQSIPYTTSQTSYAASVSSPQQSYQSSYTTSQSSPIQSNYAAVQATSYTSHQNAYVPDQSSSYRIGQSSLEVSQDVPYQSTNQTSYVASSQSAPSTVTQNTHSISYTVPHHDYEYLEQYKNGNYHYETGSTPVSQQSDNLQILAQNSANGVHQSDSHSGKLITTQTVTEHSGEVILDQTYQSSPVTRPVITKHIYFHVPPADVEERPVSTVPTAPPKKVYNILFIKVPSQNTRHGVSLQSSSSQQAPAEDKTLIYVLVKQPELQTQPQLQPRPVNSEHEVFYVKYKGNVEDAANQINGRVLQQSSLQSDVPVVAEPASPAAAGEYGALQPALLPSPHSSTLHPVGENSHL